MSLLFPHSIIDFLEPIDLFVLNYDEGFKDNQLGKHVAIYQDSFPSIDNADIVIVGCAERRGEGFSFKLTDGPDAIRKAFYALYHWHEEVKVADIGNIKLGKTLADSYAALTAVVGELIAMGKRVVIIGGSHDVTMAQYEVYKQQEQIVEATVIDARIDMNMESVLPADFFLVPLMTGEPNFLKHYNHIGFQSYLVHPTMLETIDKLGFECIRVGVAKEDLNEMEPIIRNAQLFSFDIAAIQHGFAHANKLSPNGFSGEEACSLLQFAGLSNSISSIGIYGYNPEQDLHEITAIQISQMLWYLMDGVQKSKQEAPLGENGAYNEFHLAFAEMDTIFLQSKISGRWWMQLPNGKYMACSKADYETACNNDIPERWLRAVARG